jgi:hypothetical protein
MAYKSDLKRIAETAVRSGGDTAENVRELAIGLADAWGKEFDDVADDLQKAIDAINDAARSAGYIAPKPSRVEGNKAECDTCGKMVSKLWDSAGSANCRECSIEALVHGGETGGRASSERSWKEAVANGSIPQVFP